MLPKNRRVERQLFTDVLQKTRISSTDFFTVRYFLSKEEFETKIAVVISKKVSGSAVKRNLIKRRIHAVLEVMKGDIKDSYILFIFPKKSTLSLPFSKFKEEMVLVFQKTPIVK